MKLYTEQQIRDAFKAGMKLSAFLNTQKYFNAPLNEDEYIAELKKKRK